MVGTAKVLDDPDDVLDLLRTQLHVFEFGSDVADPVVHTDRVKGIRGVKISVNELRGKFKYGGNVDAKHRAAVARKLELRDGLGDAAARMQLARRCSGAVPRAHL